MVEQRSPEQRAARMLRNNKYLTLATQSAEGPWCAPLAYAIREGVLTFYSAKDAVHVCHVSESAIVAGAVFDSSAVGDDVDGMQFRARCSRVEGGPELDTVVEQYFQSLFPEPDAHAFWYRPSSEFSGDGLWRFYELQLTEAYVIELENFATTKIDKRTSVDVAAVFQFVEQ